MTPETRAQMCTKPVEMCPLEVIRDAALTVHRASKCVRFLYVPLPVFSAPDDVGRLLNAKQCGEDLKLSEILLLDQLASETFARFSCELLKPALVPASSDRAQKCGGKTSSLQVINYSTRKGVHRSLYWLYDFGYGNA